MTLPERRYDLDWLRVIAVGLLMIYHVAIVFQPWGLMIGFITNEESWESLWIPMSMLNVWRIPLLFFVSGMGVYFSFQNKNWKQLLKERTLRIFVPFLFGIIVIVPMYMFILQNYYQWKLHYLPSPGHLWFLGNSFSYVILGLPFFFYLKKYEHYRFIKGFKKIISSPIGLAIIIIGFITEVLLVKPALFELYASTWHGFFLGWLAFIFGYCLAFCGKEFWNMLVNYKWLFLLLAIVFYALRLIKISSLPQNINVSIESCLWIFSAFAFGNKYLNKNTAALIYLSKAAYPVYILHMIFISLSCLLILPITMCVELKFFGVLIGTILFSLLCYEFLIKKFKLLKLVFGIK